MASNEDANRVIEKLNNTIQLGKEMTIVFSNVS